MNDCRELQWNVDLLPDWCSKNKLVMNKDKCISISYSRKHDICQFDYKIDNHTLSSRSSTKDLGIWFDSRLVFVAALLKLFGFLFRSCNEFRSVKCLTTLYFSLVRSRLEYGSIIWSPYYVTYIKSIESVQRKFLKYLSFKEHNKVDRSSLLSGLCISVPQILSRSHRYFHEPRANTNVLNHSPSFRMCSRFNCFNDICDLHAMPLPSILVVISCNLDRLQRLI
jgi:hypothetical protein